MKMRKQERIKTKEAKKKNDWRNEGMKEWENEKMKERKKEGTN